MYTHVSIQSLHCWQLMKTVAFHVFLLLSLKVNQSTSQLVSHLYCTTSDKEIHTARTPHALSTFKTDADADHDHDDDDGGVASDPFQLICTSTGKNGIAP